MAERLGELGYPAAPKAVARRLERLRRDPASWVYVATGGGDRVVGLGSLHVMPRLEHDEPLGRLTALVVAGDARGGGVGRTLLEHIERRARREGCSSLDLTSSHRREDAHAFYREMGLADVAQRFVKELSAPGRSGASRPDTDRSGARAARARAARTDRPSNARPR